MLGRIVGPGVDIYRPAFIFPGTPSFPPYIALAGPPFNCYGKPSTPLHFYLRSLARIDLSRQVLRKMLRTTLCGGWRAVHHLSSAKEVYLAGLLLGEAQIFPLGKGPLIIYGD